MGSNVGGNKTGGLRDNWDPSLGESVDGQPGRYRGPDPRGVPSPDAYDAIQQAADLAVGRAPGNPEDGRKALQAIIKTESHDPAWRLAARFAFENNIDLADGSGGLVDYFNPTGYANARDSGSVEVQRTLYGTDPTYGYGGTPEKRDARRRSFGLTDQDRIDILNRVR